MICQNCGKSIPEDSKFCPYCAVPTVLGQPDSCATEESVNTSQAVNYKKRKKGIIPIFIVATLALGIFGIMAYGSDDSQVSATESTPPETVSTALAAAPIEKPDLELLSDECTVNDYSTHVIGKVKNNTSKQYTYVQIQYALYDKDENQIGTALANVNGLESGGTWKFDAIGLPTETYQYKLINLTGY